jgi:hypothetical protein
MANLFLREPLSGSQTQIVVYRSIYQKGPRYVEFFDGMFAFAIFKEEKGTYLLAILVSGQYSTLRKRGKWSGALWTVI